MSIDIAICDDEALVLQRLIRFLKKFSVDHCMHFNIDTFQNGWQLCQSVLQAKKDIILLDIEMNGKNGFAIAKFLNQIDSACKIIFITNHDEWVQEGYKYHAYRYVYKFQMEKNLEEALLSATNEIWEDTGFRIKDKNLIFRYIKYKDVCYIESLGDEICIYSNDTEIIARTSLKEMNKQLDDRFFRCHNQYVINYDFMIHWDKKTVTLKNGIEIPIARSRKKQFTEAYENYMLHI